MNAPPIHEPWKTDKTGKIVSIPWILWLQRLATELTAASTSASAVDSGYAKKFLLMGG